MAISSSLAHSSSSTKSAPHWMHDVFLSFRGRDTRNSFTAHLYAALVQKGIKAYKDDKQLERGSNIEPKLWKAIEDSMFSIVIFSNDYASSPWCLQELVKITHCMKTSGHIVLPIFYDVDPSNVDDQSGDYDKAFAGHMQQYNKEEVKEWRDALRNVANLSGWDVRNRDESEIIKEIVNRIWNDVSQAFLTVDKDLIGMDFRIEKMNEFLAEDLTEVRLIGISGMGGIGKTTLAKAMYNKIYWQFEGSCFLANVRKSFKSHGKDSLRKDLLSQIMRRPIKDAKDEARGATTIRRYLQSKKVLIILDDVDDLDQLQELVGERSWFGKGSRVIITTRNNHLLSTFGVDEIYKVDLLRYEEAFELFALKAFKQKKPQEEFLESSKLVVAYAQGLPLALSILGAHLYGKSVNEWKSAIRRLEKASRNKILDALKISYDGLEDLDKQIFLDIACFLNGMDKDEAINILEGCGFDGYYGVSVLIDKSLINISKNKLQMHDLLQRLGREIVNRENPKEPGKRSRLWEWNDIFHVMQSYKEGEEEEEAIETIFLDVPLKVVRWNMKAFLKLRRLRLLTICNIQAAEGPTYLSEELRYLKWHFYHSKALPPSFDPCNLVELDLSYSILEKLWHGNQNATNLRILKLSSCWLPNESLDFSRTPNIERLDLSGCVKLTELHESFQYLKKLVVLNLSHCSHLVKFPNLTQAMPHLQDLILDYTSLVTLPKSIRKLTGLVQLSLVACAKLRWLPKSIVRLKKLKILNLLGCSSLKKLPENLGLLESLEVLELSATAVMQLPTSTFDLRNLKTLIFEGQGFRSSEVMKVPSLSSLCSITELQLGNCNLEEGSIPDDIGCLSKLVKLNLSRNNFVSLPTSLNQLSMLQELKLMKCRMLQSLPEIPPNVQEVSLGGCVSLKEAPDPMKLCNIKGSVLQLFNCTELYKSNWRNHTASVMLQRYLQGFPIPRSGFQVFIPGSKIPEWFTYMRKGSSIIIPTPPTDFLLNKVIGIAACVALDSEQHMCGTSVNCIIRTKNSFSNILGKTNIALQADQPPACDHFWSFYFSLENTKVGFTEELIFEFSDSFYFPMKNTKFGFTEELEFDKFEFSDGLKYCEMIKECGVRLVTFEDVEELNTIKYLEPQVDEDEDLKIDAVAAEGLTDTFVSLTRLL